MPQRPLPPDGQRCLTKLINHGPGELSDRLTILSLKILFGREAGKEVAHFETEQTALLQQIRSRTLNGAWFDKVLELAAVNSALWHSEDELRDWRHPERAYGAKDMDAIRVVAFRIQALNDKRADLIQQINKEAGEGSQAEKL